MRVVLELGGQEHEVVLQKDGDVLKMKIDGEAFDAKMLEPGVVQIGDHRFHVRIGDHHVTLDGRETPFRIHEFQPTGGPGGAGGARGARVKPPMPGKVVSVAVHEGATVEAGAVLVILEAMKMQNEITAPAGGVIKKVHVKAGQNVEAKDVLVEIE